MKIKEFNGLNIAVDKKLELMLAIQAVSLKHNPSKLKDFDYIEIPPIKYLDELDLLFNSVNYQELINDILKFTDESACVEIALSLNDNYEFNKTKAKFNLITTYLGSVNLNDFIFRFKSFAHEINWDLFFAEHLAFYQKLFSDFCTFPKNFNLHDFEKFYGVSATSYNYIPSVLMNGGFSYNDELGNIYYIRGFLWQNDKNSFIYDKEYLLECLFHEFSHFIINPLIDKYFSSFIDVDKIYHEAVEQNLPKTYGNRQTLLYEYFVRANANILTRKYYESTKISDWILQHGFLYLEEIIDFTMQNVSNYNNYEDFFIKEMIPFVNNISNSKNKYKM